VIGDKWKEDEDSAFFELNRYLNAFFIILFFIVYGICLIIFCDFLLRDAIISGLIGVFVVGFLYLGKKIIELKIYLNKLSNDIVIIRNDVQYMKKDIYNTINP